MQQVLYFFGAHLNATCQLRHLGTKNENKRTTWKIEQLVPLGRRLNCEFQTRHLSLTLMSCLPPNSDSPQAKIPDIQDLPQAARKQKRRRDTKKSSSFFDARRHVWPRQEDRWSLDLQILICSLLGLTSTKHLKPKVCSLSQ